MFETAFSGNRQTYAEAHTAEPPAVSVRRGIAAALTACAVAGGGAAAAWILQAAALPRPARGNVVAARAMGWLRSDRVLESTFVIGTGRPVRSRCTPTRLPVGEGRPETAVLVDLDGARHVVVVGPPYLTIRGTEAEKPRGLALARLALAGCAPVLRSLIGSLVGLRSAPPVGRARIDGRAAQTLRIWTKAGRVTVYLDETSKRPLAVALAGRRLTGRARLRLPRGGA
jgi:hypothetical protein